jgi:hypothetical protein
LGFPAGFFYPRSRGPNNFDNILPGHAEHPPIIYQINKKMDGISQKVDAALANQRLIIDCLQNNGFLNRLSSTRSSVPEAAEQNRINFNVHLTNHNTMLELQNSML